MQNDGTEPTKLKHVTLYINAFEMIFKRLSKALD